MGFSAVAAVAAVGAGVAAASSASNKKSAAVQGTTETREPWGEQKPYLTDTFKNAQNIYNTQKDTPYYQGNLYTGLNDTQLGGIGQTKDWVNGTGGTLRDSTASSALSGLSGASAFNGNAQRFAQGNYGAGVPASQAGALSSFGNAAVGGYGDYKTGLQGVLASAQADPTQGNIKSAQDYMNSGALQEQIAAASADVNHTLGTNLVGLNNQASAGGNLNSSRAGAAEAAMRGEAGRTIGNLSAQLRSNAYTSGLQLAENSRQANLSTSLGALGQQAGMIGQGVGALNAAEAARQSEIGNRLSGNSQLGTSVGLGYQGATSANQLGLGNASALTNAGGLIQTDANNANDAAYQQWQGEDTRQWELLNRYAGIVGSNNWGGTKVAKTPYAGPTPLAAGLQGGLGTLASLWGMGGSGGGFGQF